MERSYVSLTELCLRLGNPTRAEDDFPRRRWALLPDFAIERRRASRRAAHLLEVFLSDPELSSGFQSAQLTDISPGGLGLWRFQPLTVGERYNVGIPNAHGQEDWDTIFWVQVEVVHRRRDQLGWAMGCRFLRPMSREVAHQVELLIAE